LCFGGADSCIRAGEAAADIGTLFIDAATSLDEKFTAIVDLQLVRSVERKLQASGTQLLQSPILIPADLNGGKRVAADTAALQAAIIAITGYIKEDSAVTFLVKRREEHRRSFR
jgi:hypothetical protein